jgi:YYY domain-containing protein
MTDWKSNRGVILILLLLSIGIGVALRGSAVRHGLAFHPDERHIVMTALNMNEPYPNGALFQIGVYNEEWIKSWLPTLNHLRSYALSYAETVGLKNPKSFPYGSFPFYLLTILAAIVSKVFPFASSYDGLFVTGRWLSVLISTLTVYATYRLACELFQKRIVGLLAATFLSFNIFHIQLSHFYTVDTLLTLLGVVALHFMVRIARRGTWCDFLGTGVLIGLSLATKISALSLYLPLALAYCAGGWSLREFFSTRRLFLVFLTLVLSVFTFVAVMPYAIIDFETYLRHTTEQIAMARGDWVPPYTVQYLETAPYLYPLKQMILYTVGIPLAILGIGGMVGSFRRWRELSFILPAIWAIVVFAILGKYQVKFPRYLLPFYPFLFIYGAGFLAELWEKISERYGSRIGASLPGTVVVYSIVTGVGFSTLYWVEHPYVQASQWVYQNIPSGARILGVHWDDKLPLSLPGLSAHQYRFEGADTELKFYEPDTEAKKNELLQQLEHGDYLIFPTPRMQGSIPRVIPRYPFSSKVIKLLYTGALGYELKQTVKTRPVPSFLFFNDDLADESFTVYDHPKVSIFQNVRRLTAREMREVVDFSPSDALPSMNAVLLTDSGRAMLETPKTGIMDVLTWYILAQVLSFLVFPFIARALPAAPDRGFGVSKTVGIFFFGFVVWYLTALNVLSTTTEQVRYLFGIFLVLGILLSRDVIKRLFNEVRPHIVGVEAIFLLTFLLFVVFRAFQPEIFWGEKPMDSTFLHYFYRLEDFPPEDPWAAGFTMRYYYFGLYLMAVFHKLSGTAPAYGYNISLALLAALIVTAAYSILIQLVKRPSLAITGSLCLLFLANLEVVSIALFGHCPTSPPLSAEPPPPCRPLPLGFDLFWASTRLFSNPAFTEYPLWSLLFGDLHAHVISIPFTVALLAFLYPLFMQARQTTEEFFWLRIFIGLLLGTLMLSNSWDFITFSLLIAFLYLGRFLQLFSWLEWRWALPAAGRLVVDGLFILAIAIIASTPGFRYIFSGNPVGFGYVTDEEFNSLGQILRMYGVWLVPLLIGIGATFPTLRIRFPQVSLAIGVSLIPFACVAISLFHGVTGHAWGIVLFSALVSALGALTIGERKLWFPALLTIFSALFISFWELFFLESRMNSIFKFYQPLWLLLCVATFGYLFTPTEKRIRLPLHTGAILGATAALTLSLGLVGGFFDIFIMTTHSKVDGPRPTLDGQAYLRQQNGDEAAIIRWLNKKVPGTPTTLEAWGNAYQDYTRIAMHTGLPTVLGWEHHVFQRGVSRENIGRRRSAIQEIYQSRDKERTRSLIDEYQVKYIVVGQIERRTYGREITSKFLGSPELFPLLFRAGESMVFGTPLTFQ